MFQKWGQRGIKKIPLRFEAGKEFGKTWRKLSIR
jgi:hypothetical protein